MAYRDETGAQLARSARARHDVPRDRIPVASSMAPGADTPPTG